MDRTPYVVALDVGGTSVKSAAFAQMQLLDTLQQTPVNSQAAADTIINSLCAIIRWHQSSLSGELLAGLAVSFPGPFDYAQGISRMTGIAKYDALYGLNIGDQLRKQLGYERLPVRFRNDAEAAVVGEARYGAGQPFQRLIGITLGTGLGSAFVVDGEPVTTGAHVPPHGWLYPYPFNGQMADAVFGQRGLVARLQQIDPTLLALATAASQAEHGDQDVITVFADYGADLATFLQPWITAWDAEALLVLGGISALFPFFGPTLAEGLAIPVRKGTLGYHGALYGAAAMFSGDYSNEHIA